MMQAANNQGKHDGVPDSRRALAEVPGVGAVELHGIAK